MTESKGAWNDQKTKRKERGTRTRDISAWSQAAAVVRRFLRRQNGSRVFQLIEGSPRRHVAIQAIPGKSSSPEGIVEQAADYIREEGTDVNVWVAFDWDGRTNEVRNAERNAEKAGINVALSNPAFEIRLIWHFKDYMRHGCSQKHTEQELRNEWPSYHKGSNDWSRLHESEHQAADRAYHAEQYLEGNNAKFPNNRPSSQIYLLMEEVKSNWTAAIDDGKVCPVGRSESQVTNG